MRYGSQKLSRSALTFMEQLAREGDHVWSGGPLLTDGRSIRATTWSALRFAGLIEVDELGDLLRRFRLTATGKAVVARSQTAVSDRSAMRDGMSLRDRFAAKALGALLVAIETNSDAWVSYTELADECDRDLQDLIASRAFSWADAMLKARQA